MRLPSSAREVLEEATLCYLAAPSRRGPHVTPVVFALEGERVWGTTGRGTTKARLWRKRPVAGGLIRHGGRALVFGGGVTLYDVLDPATWPSSVLRSPQLALASTRFTLKNARFFAGYARDVGHIPFAWSPPGRVVFSVDLDRGAMIQKGEVGERWGDWGDDVEGLRSFREARGAELAGALPEQVAALASGPRDAVVGLAGAEVPVVLPATATPFASAWYATLPRELLSLAGPRRSGPAAVVVDEASAWRAAKMRGLLVRGLGSVYVLDEVKSGREKLHARAGDVDADAGIVRVVPSSIVWWSGWSSGTVALT